MNSYPPWICRLNRKIIQWNSNYPAYNFGLFYLLIFIFSCRSATIFAQKNWVCCNSVYPAWNFGLLRNRIILARLYCVTNDINLTIIPVELWFSYLIHSFIFQSCHLLFDGSLPLLPAMRIYPISNCRTFTSLCILYLLAYPTKVFSCS